MGLAAVRCWVSEEQSCSENRFNLFSQASLAWEKCKAAPFPATGTPPSLSSSPLLITCFSSESASHFNCIASLLHSFTHLFACIIPPSLFSAVSRCISLLWHPFISLSPLSFHPSSLPSEPLPSSILLFLHFHSYNIIHSSISANHFPLHLPPLCTFADWYVPLSFIYPVFKLSSIFTQLSSSHSHFYLSRLFYLNLPHNQKEHV